MKMKKFDPDRTQTCNLLIRSQMPCPFGHRASHGAEMQPTLVKASETFNQCTMAKLKNEPKSM